MNFDITEKKEKEVKTITPNSNLVIAGIKKTFDPLLKEVKENVSKIIINCNDSKLLAADFLGKVKALNKRVKGHSEEVTKTQKLFIKEIDNFVRPYLSTLAGISTELSNKLAEYSYKEEIERREKEKKIREAQEQAIMEIKKAAEKNNISVEDIILPPAPVVKKETTTKVSNGSFYIKKTWDYEIVDINKIPKEYVQVVENKPAIKAAIAAGIREIEGIKIFEKANGNFRS